MFSSKRFLQTLIVLFASSNFILPASAASPTVTEPITEEQAPVSDLVPFAHIDTDRPDIIVSLEGVKLNIKRVPDAQDIVVASNCPAHWNVRGAVLRQVAFATTSKGISLRADGMGSILMVNGHLYPLPQEANGSMHGLSISQDKGKVIINGQAIDPIPGSDVPGNCTGLDTVELQIPTSYRGGLILSSSGAAQISIDTWHGGSFVANLADESSLTAGSMDGLSKAVLDIRGKSKAQIAGIVTQAMVADLNGSGSLDINGGSAQFSNATVSGTGKMTLHGKFKNLKQAVTGSGTINILE